MKKAAPKPAAEPENDLDVLLSTRDITIAGKPITVREVTLVDSLVLHDSLAPMVASLADVMQTEYPRFEEVQQVLAKHATVLPVLIAHCTDQPVEWVQTLPGSEGLALMDWWWAVNRRFFYGRCHPHPAAAAGQGEDAVGFGCIFATLIRAGHNPDRLGHYTARQLTLYYREALQLQKQDSIHRILDVIAGHAGGQAATTRINALK